MRQVVLGGKTDQRQPALPSLTLFSNGRLLSVSYIVAFTSSFICCLPPSVMAQKVRILDCGLNVTDTISGQHSASPSSDTGRWNEWTLHWLTVLYLSGVVQVYVLDINSIKYGHSRTRKPMEEWLKPALYLKAPRFPLLVL